VWGSICNNEFIKHFSSFYVGHKVESVLQKNFKQSILGGFILHAFDHSENHIVTVLALANVEELFAI
jgi:hypothetical protein